MNGKFYIILFIFLWSCKPFCSLREIWVVKGIVPVVEGLNIINLYANYDQVTGPEQPICSTMRTIWKACRITFKMLCPQISKFYILKY